MRKSFVSRYVRLLRRGFAVLFAAAVLSASVVPASADGNLPVPVHQFRPTDGVGDSPEMP